MANYTSLRAAISILEDAYDQLSKLDRGLRPGDILSSAIYFLTIQLLEN